jgi:hypothetical protein
MNRCNNCKKKIGIMNFSCRCDYKNLCSKCLSNHNCNFDYKKDWKESLTKRLPVVIADKIEKI